MVNTLDKEEFRIKLEEINKLVQDKDYKGAMSIVDSIDWRRVKNVRTLCVVGEIYAANGRYEDSKEIFLLAYHKASVGKNILYRLIEISLRMDDISEAEDFFEEYRQVASNDNTQYILQYKIAKAKNASLNEQIRILEEYKEQEFTEKWSYELAALYYKAGEKQKCLDLCNEIILWFSEGKYVMKSYDLKMRMGELTGAEKAKYEKQFIPKLITPEQAKELKKQETESESEQQEDETVKESGDSKEQTEEIQKIEVMEESEEKAPAKPIDMASMQAQISKNIKDIFGGKSLERENFTEESVDMIDGAGITKEDEIPEEIIKSDVSEKEPENVPELEAEPEKPGEAPVAVPAENNSEKAQEKENPVDFGATIKMPELNIPDSMKNMELSKAPKVEDVAGSFASASIDFNLEDTILAAANAQGIEIPKEETEEETQGEALQNSDKSNELEEPDFLSENIIEESEPDETPTVEDYVETGEPVLQEEEEVTEEDLRRAEAEFLHGPVDNADLNLEDIEDSDLDTEELVSAPEAENEEPLSEEEELERFIESIQSKDETDPRNLVPREKELTDDEKQLFTYFVKVPGMKEQLVDTLCDVQMAAADKTSKTGNIIVMGGKECGKTRLISGLIPAICKELNLEASKVAYVFAEQINGKNIYKIFAKLAGGFLVIENANQLTQETVEMLDKAMEVNTDGLTVIVEDEKIGMRKFIARYPKFAKKFTSMINIPVFTNDELVNFARIYTKENGYIIDQMGMLALYNLIGINQKEDLPMNIGAVKEMIDAAIAKSQGGIRKFKRNISKKRIDRDGYIVLYEKDFTK
ncbi:hypothetical protein G4422_09920 [Blautia wexlerae]|nr:hypothetical protein [Blautia wexlerae]NSE03739.1 hypothetical protein [Blautia wexlerae]NSF77540.1 hypothetical protein [Blautia wexlerae]